MEPPKFGILEKVKKNGKLKQVSRFTMEDIYENRISYKHTGGDSRVDWFSFIVSDGTNKKFTVDGQSADRATLQPQVSDLSRLFSSSRLCVNHARFISSMLFK